MHKLTEPPGSGGASLAKVRRLTQRVSAHPSFLEESEPERIEVAGLVRRYLPLALLLIAIGGLIGTAVGIIETPRYKTSLLLEIRPISKDFLGQVSDPFSSLYNLDDTNLQTELLLLQTGPFKSRVIERMKALPALKPPPGDDLFSRLRRMLLPGSVERSVSRPQALAMAAATFDARIINETRLVQLSCESPHPVVTSEFLNDIANEFVQDSLRIRTEAQEKTSAWLASHIDDTKAKLDDADARLRAFVLRSGNLFAGSDTTVDDVKLKQLQAELAAAQTVRIARQAEYETAMKSRPDALSELVHDPIAATTQSQLAELARQKALLLITLTPLNPKVKAIEQQQHDLETALKQQASTVIDRLKSDYDNALAHEKLLLGAYAQEGGQVTSQASKAAEYSSLRREVDVLQKRYDSLLQELNKTQVAQSAPVTPVRLVELSVPPELPYKPQPKSEIVFGLIAGLAATAGIVFLREKSDRRLRSPEAVQGLVRVPQLGVIPTVGKPAFPALKLPISMLATGIRSRTLPAASETTLLGRDSATVARATWEHGASLLADSFRAIVASISRHLSASSDARVIMVTSAMPGEGKTTIVSNLGIAWSEAGKRVLIVDADFRRPSLSKVFGLEQGVTLPSILESKRPIGEYPLEYLAMEATHPGLYVLPCGGAGSNLPTLIYSDRLPQLLERLRHEFDLVIVDVPPILFPADARVVSQFVDGVVLVIRAGHSERESIRAAVHCLHEDGVPILGTVLNDWVPSGTRSKSHYYSYYAQAGKT